LALTAGYVSFTRADALSTLDGSNSFKRKRQLLISSVGA